ncbi:hypothetical protein EC991_002507 [Linnemannia zychae]|nr:hypothetical protein EC991_002507 [Linnemannia zychae]
MKSTTFLAIAASTVVSVATAELLSYGAPISTTVWTAGSDATISWSNDCSDLANTTFPVVLQIQRLNNDKIQDPVPGLAPLGTIDCSEPNSITIKVPTTVATGSKYSVLVNRQPDPSYSALFTINNPAIPAVPGTGTNTTTTGPATPSGTTSTSGTASVKPSVTTPSTTTPTNAAGAIKAGSVAALAVAGAVAALIF